MWQFIVVLSIQILSAVFFLLSTYHAGIFFSGMRGIAVDHHEDSRRTAAPRDRPPLSALPTFSIIVPAKNEEMVLRRAIKHLLAVNYPREKLEIIIVEDGSQDETPAIARGLHETYPSQVRWLHLEQSRGKPHAINEGAKIASGDIIAILDADSVLEKDCLTDVASRFRDDGVDGVQISFRSLNGDDNLISLVSSLDEFYNSTIYARGKERFGLFVPLLGTGQFIRRATLRKLSFWDETSLTEDIELAFRLWKSGYTIKPAPAIVWKEEPANISEFIHQRRRWYRGYLETLFKYFGTLMTLRPKAGIDVAILLASPIFMGLGLIAYVLPYLALLLDPSPALVVIAAWGWLPTTAGLVTVFFAVTSYAASLRLCQLHSRKNYLLFPFLYLYWALNGLIAWSVFLRRPQWTKTKKTGGVSPQIPYRRSVN